MDPEMMEMMAQAGHQIWSGVPGIAQGLWGHSDRPYQKAGEAYQPYYHEAQGYQNPFFQAGQGALGDYQGWLKGQQDPSGFINHLMGQYQESPWAKYQQQQAMRAAQNMGSASGLTGSTPLQLQAQQNASNISSGDMQNWISNVLGINTNYGTGLQGLIQGGQGAANNMSSLASNAGEYMGGVNYGEQAGKNMDRNSLWSGIAKIFGG